MKKVKCLLLIGFLCGNLSILSGKENFSFPLEIPIQEEPSLNLNENEGEIIPITEFDTKEGKWYNDVVIVSGKEYFPAIARAPGSSTKFFCVRVHFPDTLYYVRKSTNGGESWPTAWGSVKALYTDIAVTNEYVFVVYEWQGNVYMKKYDHSGTYLATYTIAGTSDWEMTPSICTDAEYYSSDEWLYIVWFRDDSDAGTEVYAGVYREDGSPVYSPTRIIGSGSSSVFYFPKIAYDHPGKLHVVAWDTTQKKIIYRGATNYGGNWGSAFYFAGPPSGYIYRLPRVDAQDGRVLITWERIKSDYSEVYTSFVYSTNGGVDPGNFSSVYYFTTQYWRAIPVIINTSNKWYMVRWRYSQNKFYVNYNYSTDPGGSWYIGPDISDIGYNLLPWDSFDGITCGDNKLAVIWTDGNTHLAFDAEWRGTDIDEAFDSSYSKEFFLNFPNPIYDELVPISFGIPKDTYIKLGIYDILGNNVCTLIDKELKRGHYKIIWDKRNFSGQMVKSGIYFLHFNLGEHRQTKKLIILK